MSDFYEMSARMKELFPSNPEADKKALLAMAGNTTPVETPTVVQESVDVPQGSLQIDKDYSVSDFAALAGVKLNETQKTGSAGQAKGKDPTPKMSKPSNTGEQPHPLKDRLVGESDKDDRIAALERRVEALESMLQERELSKGEEKEKERIVTGMKKNKSDFKDRYGNDAEAVMYATATKRAKQNASVDYSSDIKTRLYDALNKKMGV